MVLAFWFGLAIIGQAVSLQLIDAGHALRYQHYKPFWRLSSEVSPVILVMLGLQIVLVAGGIKAHLPAIRSWVQRSFRIWKLLAVGVVFILTSATVSENVRVYLAELPFVSFLQAVNLANIALVVLAFPKGKLRSLNQWLSSFFASSPVESAAKGGIDRFAILASVWVITAAALLSWFSYERHPHIADEVVYIYHARYLANGMLTMPAPPVPEAFYLDLMSYQQTIWFCPVPPGWPLVLAIGAFFGAAWLVNPVLAALGVLMASALLGQMYDRRTARLVVLLMCISPWYIFMGMNYMNHILTLNCALAAALAVIKSRSTNRALWAVAAGAAAGFVSLIRPLDGVIVVGLIGLWVIGVGGKRLRLSSVMGFVLGCVLVGTIQLAYNKMLTGDPLMFPLNAYVKEHYSPNAIAYGFGPDRGMGWAIDPNPGHGPIDALINSNLNITSINFELLGWSTGSLLLVTLMLLSGTMKKSDFLMVGVVAAVFVAYFFFYFSGGPDFGARYWFLMLIPLLALTARGVQYLQGTIEAGTARLSTASAGVVIAVMVLSALALVNYLPWRAIDKYHHYLGMRPDIRVLADERKFGRSLVLVRGKAFPDYASAAIYNPLDLHADAPVYAWDRNPEVRAEVMKAYEDRLVWIVNGPSITGRGFEVMEGPFLSKSSQGLR